MQYSGFQQQRWFIDQEMMEEVNTLVIWTCLKDVDALATKAFAKV